MSANISYPYNYANTGSDLGIPTNHEATLRFDICQLESSHALNDDIPHGASRIAEAIPPHLSYPCRFWADHLRETPFEPEILQGIKDLMYIRFSYWLEVLSLTMEVKIASKALSSTVD
jgi:hypothetical protein